MGSLEGLPISSTGSSGGLGLARNREDFAFSLNEAFDVFAFSNLMDGASLKGGSNAPKPVPNESGGAVFTPGAAASNGYIGWNTLSPPAGVAAIDAPLIKFSRAESWLVGARVKFPIATFTAATFCIPVGIVGTGAIYLQSVPSTNQLGINFFDTADHFFSGGPVGSLGTVTAPVGIYFWVSLEFNVSTGIVTPYFSDVAGTSRSGSELLHMPDTPSAPIYGYSSDNTMSMHVSHIFLATTAPR